VADEEDLVAGVGAVDLREAVVEGAERQEAVVAEVAEVHRADVVVVGEEVEEVGVG
jgi:hypothetical protein